MTGFGHLALGQTERAISQRSAVQFPEPLTSEVNHLQRRPLGFGAAQNLGPQWGLEGLGKMGT